MSMKKRWIVGMGIVGVVLGIGVGVSMWQKENIHAAYLAWNYSKEEIALQLTEVKEEGNAVLEAYQIAPIRDFTLEEEEALRSGTLTLDEAMERIKKEESSLVSDVGETAAEGIKPTENREISKSEEAKQLISEATEEMYRLKGKYIGLLGGLEARGIAEVKALPKEEWHMKTVKKLAPKYISEGYALESACNQEVEAVLGNLEAGLKNIGQDVSVIKVMRQTYRSEKAIKKAYYLSLIGK